MSISAMKASVLSGSRQIRRDPLTLRGHVGVVTQDAEFGLERRLRLPLIHLDRGERVDPIRGPMLEREITGLGKQDVDHTPFGRCEYHLLDERLPLDVSAV